MPVRLEPASCLSREAARSPRAGQTQNSDSGDGVGDREGRLQSRPDCGMPHSQTPGAWLVKGQEREHGCRDRGLALPSVTMAMPLLAKGKSFWQTGIEAVSG